MQNPIKIETLRESVPFIKNTHKLNYTKHIDSGDIEHSLLQNDLSDALALL